MKIFCLPYAGGSATIYSKWQQYNTSTLEFVPVEYPGRGYLSNIPLISDFDKQCDFLLNSIKFELVDDYCLFGHSLGSYFAYELSKKIDNSNLHNPSHVFLSAARAPQYKKKKYINQLNDTDLKSVLLDYGGTPIEVLNNLELFNYFKPILKNDFKLYDDYSFKNSKKLSLSSTIFLGTEDTICYEDVKAWKSLFQNGMSIKTIEGDHFFVNTNHLSLINYIKSTITRGE